MPFALMLIVSLVLIATVKSVVFLSAQTPDIAPVKLPSQAFDLFEPCRVSSNTERSVTFTPMARYTAEAQRRGIEGTVKLAVYFDWNGKVSIAGVISSLPYGLRQEAINAAKQIKFKPATACGGRITEPAEIHYTFPSGQGKVVQL